MTSLLPRLRGTGTHRADDRIAKLERQLHELRDENVKLLNRQAAADDYFAILWNDVIVTQQALVVKEGLRQEAEMAAAQMRMERDELAGQVTELGRQLAPYKAAAANAHRIDVPPMQRIGADQDTQPSPVLTLPEAAAAGLLGAVTNPGHVHAH